MHWHIIFCSQYNLKESGLQVRQNAAEFKDNQFISVLNQPGLISPPCPFEISGQVHIKRGANKITSGSLASAEKSSRAILTTAGLEAPINSTGEVSD